MNFTQVIIPRQVPCCGSGQPGGDQRVLCSLALSQRERPTCNQPNHSDPLKCSGQASGFVREPSESLQPKHNRSLKGGNKQNEPSGVCLRSQSFLSSLSDSGERGARSNTQAAQAAGSPTHLSQAGKPSCPQIRRPSVPPRTRVQDNASHRVLLPTGGGGRSQPQVLTHARLPVPRSLFRF